MKCHPSIPKWFTGSLTVLLAACGSSGSPAQPSPGPGTAPPGANGPCAVTVTDDITVSSTFVNSSSVCDYLIAEPISLKNGSFTIEPGTIIQFAQDARLRISDNAQLLAVGTSQQRIRFEAQAPVAGYAYGLYFTSPLESRLEYVDVINLGKEDVGLWASHDAAIDGSLDSSLALRNVSVSGSIFFGADLEDINLTAFTNNLFFGNALYGLVVDAAQAHKLDQASDYLGQAKPNGRPYVLLEGVGSGAELLQTATWQSLNTPYYVDNAVWINAGTLTLEPGVTFVMGAGSSFDVDGPAALIARGVPGNPVVFTGERQAAGYWDGLYFFESDSRENHLDYTEVRYGGGGSLIEGAVSVGLESYLKMTNSVVADSGSWGVCITYIAEQYAATFEEGGNTYLNNPLGDVVQDCDD